MKKKNRLVQEFRYWTSLVQRNNVANTQYKNERIRCNFDFSIVGGSNDFKVNRFSIE